ncbi:MAG: hotdog fold thioesterase [Bacteroidia bacterium]|nr:hotdog fold thioesterase [Bacteroidia bacterium]MCZ2248690.1 hotdog fold thioesterase [Bacteroidia bacterium]
MKTPLEIFHLMYDNDPFSKLLGMELVEIAEGYCKLKMKITQSMLNGFNIAHGGISYALSDSTMAFASNSRGIKSVSIDTSINHLAKVAEGDILTAESEEKNLTEKTALYFISVYNQNRQLVAIFKGIVYRTGKEW